ncbi:MAG: replicative DNA helicase [Elusimicrobia bacterium]|nr:replicative DNA helicase [Elusimicrobiota bacterium]
MTTTPPNNEQAERAVLGAVLIENAAAGLRVARQVLTPEMFYQESNGAIFRVMVERFPEGAGLDMVTLTDALRSAGELDKCGGQVHLSDCMDAVSATENIEHYADIVARCYYEREIIKASRDLAADPRPEKIEAVRELTLKREHLGAAFSADLADVLHDLVDQLDSKDARKVYFTGIPAVDRTWLGSRPGEINTWAAATNDGKSVLLLNLAHLAASKGARCVYFGTEMSAAELATRLVSIGGGPEAWKLRKGTLGDDDRRRYLDACAGLSRLPLRIVDHPEPGLREIEAAIFEHKAEVVFLDYLDRFTLPREESLRLRIREFMRQLKNMARRCGVVVYLASQLNRKAYGHGETAPTMAEISESSAVEKESDRVMLVWVPAQKNGAGWGRRVLEVIQEKNRHGARGVKFDLELDERTLRVRQVEACEQSAAAH